MQAHANGTDGARDCCDNNETNTLCWVTFYFSGQYRRVRQYIKGITAQIPEQGAEYVPSWTMNLTYSMEQSPSWEATQEWLFRYSEEPAASPYSWPDTSSPRCPIRCLKDPFWRYVPICDFIFPVASLFQVSPCNFDTFSFLSPSVPRAPHISYFLIWKP